MVLVANVRELAKAIIDRNIRSNEIEESELPIYLNLLHRDQLGNVIVIS